MDKFNQFRETFFFVHCISQMKFFETQYAIQKNKRDWSIGRLHKKQNLRWWKANQHQRKNRNNNRMQEDSFNSELWEFQINPQLVNWCLLQLIVVITATCNIERVNAMKRIKQFDLIKTFPVLFSTQVQTLYQFPLNPFFHQFRKSLLVWCQKNSVFSGMTSRRM